MTITITLGVYCSQYSPQPNEIHNLPPEKLGELTFSTISRFIPKDWTQVGTAEVTITLFDRNDTLKAQVKTLQEMKKNLQAETQFKLNQIEGKIQSLLALENS